GANDVPGNASSVDTQVTDSRMLTPRSASVDPKVCIRNTKSRISEADRDASQHAGGRVDHRHLVEHGPLVGLVVEVAHGDEEVPVGMGQAAQEGQSLAELEVEARADQRALLALWHQAVDAVEGREAGVA